jgi:hypothetical protein
MKVNIQAHFETWKLHQGKSSIKFPVAGSNQ